MNWFRQFLQHREIYNDLHEEIQQHLEERVKERLADGMSQAEAEHAARREFGNVTRIEQSGREVWQWSRLESALTDGKIALRQLKEAPGFTLVSLLILSFAIGASTATFSIVDSVLLRPYAFRDSGQLVVWRETIQEISKRFPSLPDNYRHYLYLRAHSRTIADAAILQNASFAVEAGNDHPQRVKGLRVSPNFFSVVGVSPIVGRTFLPQEMQEGDRDKIVITYPAWQTFFGGDPGAIGHTLHIQGRPAIIVGVLPKEFEFPNVNEMPGGATPGDVLPYEIFQPLVPTEEEATADGSDWGSLVIARLKDGVTAKQAESELDGIMKAYLGRPPPAGPFGHRRRVVLTGGDGQHQQGDLAAVRRSSRRAAHRVRESFQPAAGTRHCARPDERGARGARGGTYPAISGIAHGKPVACRYRRMRGHWCGVWGNPHFSGDCSGESSPSATGWDQLAGSGFCMLPLGADGSLVRNLSGPPLPSHRSPAGAAGLLRSFGECTAGSAGTPTARNVGDYVHGDPAAHNWPDAAQFFARAP